MPVDCKQARGDLCSGCGRPWHVQTECQTVVSFKAVLLASPAIVAAGAVRVCHAQCVGAICSTIRGSQGDFDPGLPVTGVIGRVLWFGYIVQINAQEAPSDKTREHTYPNLALSIRGCQFTRHSVGTCPAELRRQSLIEHGSCPSYSGFVHGCVYTLNAASPRAKAYTDIIEYF